MNRIEHGNQRRAGEHRPAPAHLLLRTLALALAFSPMSSSVAQQRDLAGPELSLPATKGPGPASADFPAKGKPFSESAWDRAGNVLQAWQAGRGNALDALQQGLGNQALVSQSGYFNRIDLRQVGTGNTADVTQNGSGRSALVEQYGDDNRAHIVQGAHSPNATVLQHGYHSVVTLIQY
jgi:minor curlin subunit